MQVEAGGHEAVAMCRHASRQERITAHEGYLAATNELMLMNIDYETRRSAPWPAWAMERLDRLAAAHKSLPRPKQAGRLIGIKRK